VKRICERATRRNIPRDAILHSHRREKDSNLMYANSGTIQLKKNRIWGHRNKNMSKKIALEAFVMMKKSLFSLCLEYLRVGYPFLRLVKCYFIPPCFYIYIYILSLVFLFAFSGFITTAVKLGTVVPVHCSSSSQYVFHCRYGLVCNTSFYYSYCLWIVLIVV
jgi:hypothetical protein